MDKASESILSFRPVTFHYKTDTTGTPQFGLIAEDVAKVNPDLVVRDKEGKPFTVRYDAVNAMLLNEFLKERKKLEDQQQTIAQLKSDATKQEAAAIELKSTVAQQQKAMEFLTAQLQEQAAQIQRVSAQLAAASPSRSGLARNKSAPQLRLNR
jgi:septal ring factor EnvC (AmiA/AmiB activator)